MVRDIPNPGALDPPLDPPARIGATAECTRSVTINKGAAGTMVAPWCTMAPAAGGENGENGSLARAGQPIQLDDSARHSTLIA